MARQGSINESHGAWYLRVYVGAKQRRFLLGHKRDFMSRKAVREAADRKLLELRLVSTGTMARLTLGGSRTASGSGGSSVSYSAAAGGSAEVSSGGTPSADGAAPGRGGPRRLGWRRPPRRDRRGPRAAGD